MLATSPQSASIAIARRALPAAWSAVRCAAARSMSAAATLAPTSAIASAVARPIPAPAPVTSTTLSCKIDISAPQTSQFILNGARPQVTGMTGVYPDGRYRRPPSRVMFRLRLSTYRGHIAAASRVPEFQKLLRTSNSGRRQRMIQDAHLGEQRRLIPIKMLVGYLAVLKLDEATKRTRRFAPSAAHLEASNPYRSCA